MEKEKWEGGRTMSSGGGGMNLAFSAGMGILNLMMASQKQKEKRHMEKARHLIRHSNYIRETQIGTMQNLLQNIEISRMNQARWRQNREIARAANQTRVLEEREHRKDLGGRLLQLSRGNNRSLDSLESNAWGNNLTPESGTFKTLRKMLIKANASDLQNLRENDYVARQNIIRKQEAALNKRDLYSWNAGSYYLPGPAPQLVQSMGYSAMQGMTDFASGFGQGMNTIGSLGDVGSWFKGDGIFGFGGGDTS